jgi:hypothetical protein
MMWRNASAAASVKGKTRSAKRWRQAAKPYSKRAALWSGRIFPIPKAISAIVTVGKPALHR